MQLCSIGNLSLRCSEMLILFPLFILRNEIEDFVRYLNPKPVHAYIVAMRSTRERVSYGMAGGLYYC